MANVISVKDFSDQGVRTNWRAAVGGCHFTLVGTLEHGQGPLIHCHGACQKVHRTMWMSPLSRERRPRLVSILETLTFSKDAAHAGSQWTLQVSDTPETKGGVVPKRKDKDEHTVGSKGNKCSDVEVLFGLIAKLRTLHKLKVGK